MLVGLSARPGCDLVLQGVFHTGYTVDVPSTWTPGPSRLVVAMSTDLLGGVMLRPGDDASAQGGERARRGSTVPSCSSDGRRLSVL